MTRINYNKICIRTQGPLPEGIDLSLIGEFLPCRLLAAIFAPRLTATSLRLVNERGG